MKLFRGNSPSYKLKISKHFAPLPDHNAFHRYQIVPGTDGEGESDETKTFKGTFKPTKKLHSVITTFAFENLS